MKTLRWLLGVFGLGMILVVIIFRPWPFLFFHQLPFASFLGKVLYIIIFGALLCLYRIFRGPTAADRIVAVDMLGILIVGFCAILTISTGRSWYIDIAIAWALQAFICMLAFAKYLEGKGFDE